MKTQAIVLTGLLGVALMAGTAIHAQSQGTITTDTSQKAAASQNKPDPRIAASGFIEHINSARIALATKNFDLAKQHVVQARSMMILIKNREEDMQRIARVEAGRFSYNYNTDYKYHYFPIQTGPMQMKQMSSGPIWAKNELAVTDANIVYISLDLTGDKADSYLTNVEAAIAAKDEREADKQLAKLTEALVTVDSKVSMPSEKARDNIALARHFMAAKNYDGARYALKHADDGLDEMQKDDTYKIQRTEIMTMRKDVSELQASITKKDPTMLEKADKKMGAWWQNLKNWSNQ